MRHIDYIFRNFFKGVVISSPFPIGEVLNYDIKKKFQGRGRVHFHIALHVKDAPKLNKNTHEEICELIDKYITCQKPHAITSGNLLTDDLQYNIYIY